MGFLELDSGLRVTADVPVDSDVMRKPRLESASWMRSTASVSGESHCTTCPGYSGAGGGPSSCAVVVSGYQEISPETGRSKIGAL